MAVTEVLQALGADYAATGIHSFEFRDAKNHSIVEIFLLLPPEGIQITESQRAELMPTLGGGYIADFGNDFKQIQINGSCHFYYAGTPNQGRSASPATIGGYDEFLKLRFMLSRFRDYTMTPRGKLVAPAFPGVALAPVFVLKNKIQEFIGGKKGALANQLKVVWHDYDDDNHFLVKIDQLTTKRDASDPWTASYSISMLGYQVDPSRTSQSVNVPILKKAPPLERIRKVKILMDSEHDYTSPDTLPILLQDSTAQITNQATISNPTTRVKL